MKHYSTYKCKPSRIANHTMIVGTHKIVVQRIIVEAHPSPKWFVLVIANDATAVGCAPIMMHCLDVLALIPRALHHRPARAGPMKHLVIMQNMNCRQSQEIREFWAKKIPTPTSARAKTISPAN